MLQSQLTVQSLRLNGAGTYHACTCLTLLCETRRYTDRQESHSNTAKLARPRQDSIPCIRWMLYPDSQHGRSKPLCCTAQHSIHAGRRHCWCQTVIAGHQTPASACYTPNRLWEYIRLFGKRTRARTVLDGVAQRRNPLPSCDRST